MSDTTPALLDVPGLARRLNVSERYVRKLVFERQVPFIKWSGLIRFDSNRIDDWLRAAEVPAENPSFGSSRDAAGRAN